MAGRRFLNWMIVGIPRPFSVLLWLRFLIY
jgi:hypothetical protein